MKEGCQERWRKLTAKRPRLTRRGKFVRNLICMILMAGLCYLLLGAPPLTAEQAFRRAERQHLVGPAEIIASVDMEQLALPEERPMELELFDREWARMGAFMVGEADGALSCLWQYGGSDCFNWLPKAGDVTFFLFWECGSEAGREGGAALLYTDLPGAARAEVRLREQSGGSVRHDNTLAGAGEAAAEGVFVIPVTACEMPVKLAEGAERLPGTAEITLFDEAGTAIYHEIWTEDEGGTYHEGR